MAWGFDEPMPNSFSLSPQQRRLWMLQKEAVGWPYRSWCAVRITGTIDAGRLQQAVDLAIERHEILRASFAWSGSSVPRMVVHEPRPLSVQQVSLVGFPAEARDDMSGELLRQAEPQALNRGGQSLLHCVLVQLAAQTHRLILTLPALCADTLSLDLLMSDIGRLYERLTRGERPSSAPPQYLELFKPASEPEDENAPPSTEAQGSTSLYWRRQARQTPTSGHFAFEWIRRTRSEFRPGSLRRSLSPHLAGRLRALATEYNTDLRAALLAAWRVLLERLGPSPALGLGVAFDGRNGRAERRALGLFRQHLPMPQPTGQHFHDVLEETRHLLRLHSLHRKEFDWSEAYPESDGHAFWPAGFAFERWPAVQHYADLTFALEEQYCCNERFTVELVGIERPFGLDFELHFDAERVRTDDARRLAEEFETLLRAAVADPRAELPALPMVGPNERWQLQVELNGKAGEAPSFRTFQDLFAEQARRNPDAVAVVFRDRTLTYGELDRRSAELAHTLRDAGVGPEIAVAIYLERSPEVIVCILAVLRAGGYFVPIDSALPWRRLRQLLAACQAQLVLTVRRLATAMLQPSAGVLCIDEDFEFDFPLRPSETPPASANNLAYQVFASDPSGSPKGIGVEHQQLSSYVQGVLVRLKADAGLRWAIACPFSTDVGYTALFAALASGGQLNIVPREFTALSFALGDAFRLGGFDVVKLTPPQLRLVLENDDPATLPRTWLILSGEGSSWDLVEHARRLAPRCRVMHHYGSAETAAGCLTHLVIGHDPRCANVPVGKPLPGYRVYVTDQVLRPVAKWVAGEILVGGQGIARGYCGRPRATAERFIPDPFSGESGARLFRTGDLGLHVQDASLEYLGRIDQQLEIAGRRVEPGEIEAVLRLHPAVQTAVVLQRTVGGERQLVAYVTAVQGESLRSSQLLAFLSEYLPQYMIPASFVPLRSLPMTPTGQLDRQALPQPSGSGLPQDAPPEHHVAS